MLIHCTECKKETPQKILIKKIIIEGTDIEYEREYVQCLECGRLYNHCSDYNIKEEQKALQNGKN